MRSVVEKKFYRVVDANLNRAKEGLRVCEDICRFLYDKKKLTERYKKLRHELTSIVARLHLAEIIKARDVAGDVGSKSSPVEFKRKNGLKAVLDRYCTDLVTADWQSAVWVNARKKLQAICRNCGLPEVDVTTLS